MDGWAEKQSVSMTLSGEITMECHRSCCLLLDAYSAIFQFCMIYFKNGVNFHQVDPPTQVFSKTKHQFLKTVLRTIVGHTFEWDKAELKQTH